jgi:hypothetical protein
MQRLVPTQAMKAGCWRVDQNDKQNNSAGYEKRPRICGAFV